MCFLLNAVFADLLELASELSLKTQKYKQNLVPALDLIELNDKRYRNICEKVSNEPEDILQFPKVEKLLSN